MKTRVSLIAATMVLAAGSLACSSSSSGGNDTKDGSTSDTGTPGLDGGGDAAKTDSGKDSAKSDTPTDTNTGSNTVGMPCTDDATCDTSGDGLNACSNAFFSLGTIYPTPVCVATDCDPGDGTTIETCDGDRGICLEDGGGGGLCLPACDFADDGAAPTGCQGKDVCNVWGWGKDSSGKLGGVGYCFGGCTADADCTKGDVCQRESGLCVKTKVTYTKALGDACTDADSKNCECLYLTSTNKGYCSQFCKVGDATTACPSGYTCSPALPTKDDTDGSALFSKDPAGMAASCLKNCTADADCTALNSACTETASGKVCYPKS